ncbi:4-hydroxy-tetrahydrodipicolinate reductase [Prochlorococcus marinus]|uniref:4-hydroxy-tetrahydrodipicolinate reductase n=1 Tax=Prochlorococcus marinus (strain MIT 9211) TaxID=93059 RepID=A9BAK4_PROM4|nr:4-hydroxy-tetrahydrodipicolinate reductase [Prochlorococcus marinus]ABX08866.1 Dihydrodipicolinate reductase [Prochlorococcus marinus str. MIT 9211]
MTSSATNQIPVLVSGALGKMGSEVVKTIQQSTKFQLEAAIDTSPSHEDLDVGDVLGIGNLGVTVTSDLEGSLCAVSQKYRDSSVPNAPVLIDFTQPSVVYENTRSAIAYGIHPVIGTTGLTQDQIIDLSDFARKASIGGAIIPNFSVGIVLLQQAAAAASSFYENIELIESHHNQKKDAPSGTCLKTAELIEETGKKFNTSNVKEEELIEGCRGGLRQSGINIHSIRLPGIVARQEVIFGGVGETYVLSHNTVDRAAYMPGVKLVASKVRELTTLVYGLERLL